jgi:hypothetical protein
MLKERGKVSPMLRKALLLVDRVVKLLKSSSIAIQIGSLRICLIYESSDTSSALVCPRCFLKHSANQIRWPGFSIQRGLSLLPLLVGCSLSRLFFLDLAAVTTRAPRASPALRPHFDANPQGKRRESVFDKDSGDGCASTCHCTSRTRARSPSRSPYPRLTKDMLRRSCHAQLQIVANHSENWRAKGGAWI